jgi:HEAT repeat protein
MGRTKKEEKKVAGSISKSKGQVAGEKESPAEALIADLASHSDEARVEARRSLVAMGKKAVPSLTGALRNGKYLMRWEAAKALGQIGDPAAAPALVEALEDEVFDVRWLAAVALIGMNVRGLRPLLQALIEKGDSVYLREGAHHVIHDLNKGGLRKYLAPVLASLEDVEPSLEAPQAAFHTLEMLQKDGVI